MLVVRRHQSPWHWKHPSIHLILMGKLSLPHHPCNHMYLVMHVMGGDNCLVTSMVEKQGVGKGGTLLEIETTCRGHSIAMEISFKGK